MAADISRTEVLKSLEIKTSKFIEQCHLLFELELSGEERKEVENALKVANNNIQKYNELKLKREQSEDTSKAVEKFLLAELPDGMKQSTNFSISEMSLNQTKGELASFELKIQRDFVTHRDLRNTMERKKSMLKFEKERVENRQQKDKSLNEEQRELLERISTNLDKSQCAIRVRMLKDEIAQVKIRNSVLTKQLDEKTVKCREVDASLKANKKTPIKNFFIDCAKSYVMHKKVQSRLKILQKSVSKLEEEISKNGSQRSLDDTIHFDCSFIQTANAKEIESKRLSSSSAVFDSKWRKQIEKEAVISEKRLEPETPRPEKTHRKDPPVNTSVQVKDLKSKPTREAQPEPEPEPEPEEDSPLRIDEEFGNEEADEPMEAQVEEVPEPHVEPQEERLEEGDDDDLERNVVKENEEVRPMEVDENEELTEDNADAAHTSFFNDLIRNVEKDVAAKAAKKAKQPNDGQEEPESLNSSMSEAILDISMNSQDPAGDILNAVESRLEGDDNDSQGKESNFSFTMFADNSDLGGAGDVFDFNFDAGPLDAGNDQPFVFSQGDNDNDPFNFGAKETGGSSFDFNFDMSSSGKSNDGGFLF